MDIFFIILAVYFFLIFVVARLMVPFMSFGFKFTLPVNIPKEILAVVGELEKKSQNQKEYLQAVYEFVLNKNTQQWGHSRFKAGTHFRRAWVKDLEEIWLTKKFVYCTAINYVAFVLISKSKFYKSEEVKVKFVFVNFFIHQYLQVKVGESWVDFDPAGTGIRGKPLGTHLSFFG